MTPEPKAPAKPKPSFRERMKEFIEQYGPVALGVWFAIFGLSIGLFTVIIQLGAQNTGLFSRLGLEVDGTAGLLGTLGVAYGATKLTQPIRIALWLVVTPVVARFLNRRKKPDPR